MPAEYDLIIVGGGLSGLTAAYRARPARLEVLLLEGSQRFGGSLQTDYQRRSGAGVGGRVHGPGHALGARPLSGAGLGNHWLRPCRSIDAR